MHDIDITATQYIYYIMETLSLLELLRPLPIIFFHLLQLSITEDGIFLCLIIKMNDNNITMPIINASANVTIIAKINNAKEPLT